MSTEKKDTPKELIYTDELIENSINHKDVKDYLRKKLTIDDIAAKKLANFLFKFALEIFITDFVMKEDLSKFKEDNPAYKKTNILIPKDAITLRKELEVILKEIYPSDSSITHKEPKDSSKKDEVFEIGFLEAIDNNDLIEQVYDEKTNISKFCIYNVKTKKITYELEYFYQGVMFVPNRGEEIQKKVILLPSQPEEYIDSNTLDEEIRKHIYKWLDVDDSVLKFGVLNVKLSWVFDRFDTLNYLRALGDTGQGKSRFKDTFGSVHYKPVRTSGASTPAPIFRMINKWGGTLLLDEADFDKSDESQDIIKIINLGFEKGGFILRCDDTNINKIRTFETYCPKIICTRKVFTDKAVEGRCITQIMKGTTRKDIKFSKTKSFWRDALKLRNKLLMWRFENYYLIDSENEIDFDITHLEPRMQQIVTNYAHLFNEKSELEEFKKFIEEKQADIIDERQNSFDGEIVKAIHNLYVNENKIQFTAQDIIISGNLNYNGRASSPRSIVSHLKSLGFDKSKVTRIDNKTKRFIPVDEEHLSLLFTRYGFDIKEKSETNKDMFDDLQGVEFE